MRATSTEEGNFEILFLAIFFYPAILIQGICIQGVKKQLKILSSNSSVIFMRRNLDFDPRPFCRSSNASYYSRSDWWNMCDVKSWEPSLSDRGVEDKIAFSTTHVPTLYVTIGQMVWAWVAVGHILMKLGKQVHHMKKKKVPKFLGPTGL